MNGNIIMQVSTASESIPIQGATVVISRETGNGRAELLAILTTDADGRTAPFAVATPDKELSEAPSNQQSWSDCDIIVDDPLYHRVIINRVQVFPGVDTLQAVSLIPLEEYPELWGQTERYQVTPQEL